MENNVEQRKKNVFLIKCRNNVSRYFIEVLFEQKSDATDNHEQQQATEIR